MKQNDIISIIQDNDISEYYSLKNLGIEGYAFPYQEALKIVQICKLLVIPILGGDVYSMNNSTQAPIKHYLLEGDEPLR